MRLGRYKTLCAGAVACAGMSLLAVALAARGDKPDSAQSQAEPPYLDILSASIEEVAESYDFSRPVSVAARQVRLTITLAGPPPCDPAHPSLIYGFLIDADRTSATGVRDPAFDDLGVEARICATCDPAAGTFQSPLGPVTVAPSPDGTALEILTMAALLPAVDFNWIAFAREDDSLYRLPESPESMHWAIIERSQH